MTTGTKWVEQTSPPRYRRGERFRLSQEEYDRRIAQGCEVCGTHENLHMDHDHSCCGKQRNTCGKCVRGVLCRRHNVALGYAKDDPSVLRKLADYLDKYDMGGTRHPDDED